MIEKKMLVNGQWVSAKSGEIRTIINPHDASTIARVAEGNREDAKAAIEAATTAFENEEWRRKTAAERGHLLSQIAETIRQNTEEFARLETLDTGKTLTESTWDMSDVADVFDYYARLIAEDQEQVLKAPDPDSESRLVHEPVGVCALICPWNYPLLQASWKIAPALAAGCTIVLKPSELTPLTSILFCELTQNLGIPPGVINLVLGPGESVGAELAESDQVALVSFTGGVKTGQQVMCAASSIL